MAGTRAGDVVMMISVLPPGRSRLLLSRSDPGHSLSCASRVARVPLRRTAPSRRSRGSLLAQRLPAVRARSRLVTLDVAHVLVPVGGPVAGSAPLLAVGAAAHLGVALAHPGRRGRLERLQARLRPLRRRTGAGEHPRRLPGRAVGDVLAGRRAPAPAGRRCPARAAAPPATARRRRPAAPARTATPCGDDRLDAVGQPAQQPLDRRARPVRRASRCAASARAPSRWPRGRFGVRSPSR